MFDDEINLQKILTEGFLNSEVLVLSVDAPHLIAIAVELIHILEANTRIQAILIFPFLQQNPVSSVQAEDIDLRSHLELCTVWVEAGLHVSPQQAALIVPVQSLPVLIVDAGGQRLPVVDPDVVLVAALDHSPAQHRSSSN